MCSSEWREVEREEMVPRAPACEVPQFALSSWKTPVDPIYLLGYSLSYSLPLVSSLSTFCVPGSMPHAL